VTVAAHRPAGLIRMQARMKRHPEQTLRSSRGIVRLAADFSPSQLEAACARLGTAQLQLSCHSCPHHRAAADTGVCSETPRASQCAGSRLLPITRPLINR
jgi:hypothetical protein